MGNKCLEVDLEPNGTFGGDVILNFYRDNCIIDLHPFFEEFFNKRDWFHQKPEGQQRFEMLGDRVGYRFSMIEFAETFFTNFTPKKISSFMGEHLIPGEDSDKFLSLIRNFESGYKVAIPCWNSSKLYFYPLNFSKEEMNHLILLNIGRSNLPDRERFHPYPKWYMGDRGDVDDKDVSKLSVPIYFERRPISIRDYRSIRRLRIALLEKEPRVIITQLGDKRITSLDYFTFIKRYDLPTDHLDIIRKKKENQ